jgi:hypothetical protein
MIARVFCEKSTSGDFFNKAVATGQTRIFQPFAARLRKRAGFCFRGSEELLRVRLAIAWSGPR